MADWKATCLDDDCDFEANSVEEAAKHSDETSHTLQEVYNG